LSPPRMVLSPLHGSGLFLPKPRVSAPLRGLGTLGYGCAAALRLRTVGPDAHGLNDRLCARLSPLRSIIAFAIKYRFYTFSCSFNICSGIIRSNLGRSNGLDLLAPGGFCCALWHLNRFDWVFAGNDAFCPSPLPGLPPAYRGKGYAMRGLARPGLPSVRPALAAVARVSKCVRATPEREKMTGISKTRRLLQFRIARTGWKPVLRESGRGDRRVTHCYTWRRGV
jgi:hypothetical protein